MCKGRHHCDHFPHEAAAWVSSEQNPMQPADWLGSEGEASEAVGEEEVDHTEATDPKAAEEVPI